MNRKFTTLGLVLLLGTPIGLTATASEMQTSTPASQQSSYCMGSVVDDLNEPVIGAVVQVKGTNKSVNTDVDGKFNLGPVPDGSTITVSFVGYKTQDVKWNGQPLSIKLENSENVLNEMVVIGYGTVRKADMAGSVSVLDSKAFQAQPITQASEALQGRVAGVNVISDGVPGGSVKIRIRGSNSINNSNEPLYVVDGMVRETGLEGINPEDIQSMQVLKDASSTAIYGSRGANGVVLITTKDAKKGATQITFDASVGISNATRLTEKMNAKQYAQSLVDWFGYSPTDSGLAPYLDGSNPGTDWLDEMFRTGTTQNYRLVLAKGGDNSQIYFSGNYMKHNGTMEGTEYERYAAKLNAKASLTDWLDLTVDMQASRGISKGAGGVALGGYSPLYVGYNYSPSMEMFTADGYYAKDPYNNIQENPVGMLVGGNSKRHRDVFAGHVDLRFKFSKQLSFTTSNGIDYYNLSSYSFSPAKTNPSTNSNNASNANTQRMLLQTVNNLTYINTWNDVHNLTVTGVWEATKSTSPTLSVTSNDLLTGSVGYWNLPLGSQITVSNGITDWSLLSAVGRVIYNYDNRYMFTGTFRADGSSRFQNKKWGYFPSAALAWTISNESFFENVKPIVSNLKVRTSYGVVGNQDITPYSTIPVLSQTSAWIGTTNYVGYWNNSIGTPDLRWEKTKQFDFGVDAQFLNGRFDLSVDYFYKRTSDALLLTSTSQYLGGASYYINAGEVSNSGVDIAITANIIQGKDWNWTTTLNGSFLKNEVKKMTADTPELFAGSMQSIINDYWVVKEGEAIGSFYGYKWAGIDDTGHDTYYTKDGQITRSPELTDRQVLGKASPDFTLGWNNTLTWKNWSLNAFFNGAFGQQRMNVLRFVMNNSVGNSPRIVATEYFNNYGPGKTFCSPEAMGDNVSLGECSKYVENADYFRLENLSLAYDLSKSVTRFADVRLSFSIQNLFTITSYKGSNPASFPTADAGDRANGVDTGTYPTVRTFTFGARFNF